MSAAPSRHEEAVSGYAPAASTRGDEPRWSLDEGAALIAMVRLSGGPNALPDREASQVPPMTRVRRSGDYRLGHLASWMGVPPWVVVAWEWGRKAPTRHQVARLATYFSVEPETVRGWFAPAGGGA